MLMWQCAVVQERATELNTMLTMIMIMIMMMATMTTLMTTKAQTRESATAGDRLRRKSASAEQGGP